MSRRGEVAAALALGLLVVAIRAPLLDLPLERDEGEYAYIAWRMGHGEVPYRDSFDQKPPGAFVAYRLALALPGDPVVAIRVVASVAAALGVVALYFVVAPLLGVPAAIFACLLLGFLGADPMIQGPMANTEVFMLPALVAAAAFFLRGLQRSKGAAAFFVVAGVFLGVATAFKQVAAVNGLFFALLVPLVTGQEDRWRRVLFVCGCLALGGALLWLPLFAWFGFHGALSQALDAIVFHNLDYVVSIPASRRLWLLVFNGGTLLASQGTAWLLALVGLAGLLARKPRFPALFLGGWVLANAVGVSASGYYFPHYFQQLLPMVAACAGAVLCDSPLWRRVSTRWRAGLAGTFALVPLLIVLVGFWVMSPANASRRIYPGNDFGFMPVIAREIAAQSSPEETVFVFGAEPELLFYSQRASATRYIHLFPLFGRYGDAYARQREVVDEIASAKPAVIVWNPNAMFFGPGIPQYLPQRLLALLEEQYRLHAVVERRPGEKARLLRVTAAKDVTSDLSTRPMSTRIFVRQRENSTKVTPNVESPGSIH